MTTLEDLPWGSLIGERLSLRSLGALATTSRALRQQVDGADSLWAHRFDLHFREAVEGGCATDGGGARRVRGKRAFARAWQRACRLQTAPEQQARESFGRAYGSTAPTLAAIALSSGSSASAADAGPLPAWPPRLAVALDAGLAFAAPGRVQRRASAPQAGHSAWVGCLEEVAPGLYASGARDRTVRLWAPWGSSGGGGGGGGSGSGAGGASSSSGGGAARPAAAPAVAPVRTLRGHQDSVAALLTVPCGQSGGGGGGAAVLASASLDRTVRVWSLAPLLGGSGGGGGGGSGAGLQLAVLRGHGDAVRTLMNHPGGGACVASGARDGRVKFWDLGAAGGGSSGGGSGGGSGSGSSGCVATVRLAAPCSFLLPLDPPAAAVGAAPLLAAVAGGCVQLVDARCARPVATCRFDFRGTGARGGGAGGGSGGGAGIACAAAHGGLVACGAGRAAAVFDCRMAESTGGGGGSSGGVGSAKAAVARGEVLRVLQPRGAPVTALHLDREKLVTATRAVRLHADAAVRVWDAAGDGRLLRALSST